MNKDIIKLQNTLLEYITSFDGSVLAEEILEYISGNDNEIKSKKLNAYKNMHADKIFNMLKNTYKALHQYLGSNCFSREVNQYIRHKGTTAISKTTLKNDFLNYFSLPNNTSSKELTEVVLVEKTFAKARKVISSRKHKGKSTKIADVFMHYNSLEYCLNIYEHNKIIPLTKNNVPETWDILTAQDNIYIKKSID